jgi:hypothetical protein
MYSSGERLFDILCASCPGLAQVGTSREQLAGALHDGILDRLASATWLLRCCRVKILILCASYIWYVLTQLCAATHPINTIYWIPPVRGTGFHSRYETRVPSSRRAWHEKRLGYQAGVAWLFPQSYQSTISPWLYARYHNLLDAKSCSSGRCRVARCSRLGPSRMRELSSAN